MGLMFLLVWFAERRIIEMNRNNIDLFFGVIPENFDYVLSVLLYENKFVMVKNKNRKWEFTGGKRIENETIIEAAKRESWEESGAIIEKIKLLGYYRLRDNKNVVVTLADVVYFEDMPCGYEIETRKLVNHLPEDSELSFDDGIYQKIYYFIKENYIK